MKKTVLSILAILLVSAMLLASCNATEEAISNGSDSNSNSSTTGSDEASTVLEASGAESSTNSIASQESGGDESAPNNEASDTTSSDSVSNASSDASQAESQTSGATSEASNGSNESSNSSTVHTHEYRKDIVDPTCTTEGYTKYVCACGDNYIGDEKPTVDHDFVWESETDRTDTKRGNTTYKCSYGCGTKDVTEYYSYNEYAKLIVPHVLYWLNTYRAQEGAPAMVLSNKLTEVSQYRAKQLQTNFAHSRDDANKAAEATKCGVFFEDYPNPDTGEIIPAHWEADGYAECIAISYFPSQGIVGNTEQIEEAAKMIVEQFKRSAPHWEILSEKTDFTIYVGIGVRRGRICITLSSENQDETGYMRCWIDEDGKSHSEYIKP